MAIPITFIFFPRKLDIMNPKDYLASIGVDLSKFSKIPKADMTRETDFNLFNEYMYSSDSDFVNGIFISLHENKFNRPLKPEKVKTPIEQAFEDFFQDTDRKVVFFQPHMMPDAFFQIWPYQNLYDYFRPLYNWLDAMPTSNLALGNYAIKPQNFFCYSAHFFKEILKELNSENIFDINQWCLAYEIKDGAEIISDALFDATTVKSKLEPELGVLFMIVSKIPLNTFNKDPKLEQNKIKSYVFDNGLCTKINRSSAYFGYEVSPFAYRIEFRDIFLLESDKDSIRVLPIESICVHFNYPFSCTIIFNDQSLYFDGTKLVLMENGQKPSYITSDGTWVMQKENTVIIDHNGEISQKIDDTWTSVTADMKTFVDAKRVNRKAGFFTNLKTNTKSMVRPDGIEYYIEKDGSRRIMFNVDLTIEQSDTGITYDVTNFPLIKLFNGSFTTQIDRFSFTFSKEKLITLKCENYTIEFDGQAVKAHINDHQVDINANLDFCDIKSPKSNLFSSRNNINDVFYSQTPQEEILKKYPPRFFAVRSDFTCIEFIRKDSFIFNNSSTKSTKVPHTYGGPVNVFIANFSDLDKPPLIFVENSPITDEQNQQLSAAFKSNVDSVEAEKKRGDFLNSCATFANGLNSFQESEYERFLRDNYEEGEEDEITLPTPAFTPSPRLLNMQYNLYETSVSDLKRDDVLNYFKSHEADFAIVENEYEIVEEEEDEEEQSDLGITLPVNNGLALEVNNRLKMFEINDNDLDYDQNIVLNDPPPPPI